MLRQFEEKSFSIKKSELIPIQILPTFLVLQNFLEQTSFTFLQIVGELLKVHKHNAQILEAIELQISDMSDLWL